MQVSPQDRAVDLVHGLQQVMMIVPVDAHEHKAQRVTQKHWNYRDQRGRFRTFRHFQLQHHDRNDDGNHAITKRL